jgi:hypothetical protein
MKQRRGKAVRVIIVLIVAFVVPPSMGTEVVTLVQEFDVVCLGGGVAGEAIPGANCRRISISRNTPTSITIR